MKHLFYIAAALLLFATFSYRSPSVAPTYKDTFGYFFTIKRMPISTWQTSMDTLNKIMGDYGIEMNGTVIRANQEIHARQLNRLFSFVVVDSVKISNGKEVK